MIDPVTGRISRGPGQPPRFNMAERPMPLKSKLRSDWLIAQTGYRVDPRSVYIAEALRQQYFNERPEEHKTAKAYNSRLPTEVMEMRTSERNSFSVCQQQWFWRYVEWLTPRRPATPLWFGSAVHEALAAYYLPGLQRGPHPAETFDKVLVGNRKTYIGEIESEETEREFVDARALGVDMLNNYVETYGTDPQFYVLATEQTFALEFKRSKKIWLRYLLTMDGLVRDMDTGRVWILEHKTARDWGILKRLRLDNQAGAYLAAAPRVLPLAELMKPDERIAGSHYNILRKAMKDTRPVNADGARTNKPLKAHYAAAFENWKGAPFVWSKSMHLEDMETLAQKHGITVLGDVSKQQPDKYFHREPVYRMPIEGDNQLKRIEAEARYMEGMRNANPDYPVLKTPGDHCAWCPFKTMCELDESGDAEAVEGFKAATMIEEDPYLAYHGEVA